MALNVLAVLQDPDTHKRVLDLLTEWGHDPQICSVPESGFRIVSESPLDLMILEYRGEARALELIQMVKEERPRCQIILITDMESVSRREIPPQLGVRNVLYRPVNQDVLLRLIQFAGRIAHPGVEGRNGAPTAEPPATFSKLIGSSPAFKSAAKVAEQAAKSPHTPILIVGESGTGKDLLARYIHDQSPRRNGPFIHVSCVSIPGELLESELFGHEAGAFADSSGRKAGLLELANGGTLFLDGIAGIELPLQAKLLRFMDSKHLRRVMSENSVPADVRVIASTHRDLARLVATRCFRTDLYHRLNGVQILLPPLRERGRDVVDLATHFADEAARRLNAQPVTLSQSAERLLTEYPWPGNIRELMDVVERAVMTSGGGVLNPEDFPIETARHPLYLVDFTEDRFQVRLPDEGVSLDTVERKVIETALERTRGNVMEAARLLRVGRGALRYKIVKHGLESQRIEARALRKAS